MNCEELRASLDAYMDGELSVVDLREMEAHAATCEDCKRELDAARLARDALAALPDEVSVPLETQARWRRAVRAEAAKSGFTRKDAGRSKRWQRAVSAVAAALVLVLGATAMRNRTIDVRRVEVEPSKASIGQSAEVEPATASNGQVAEVEPATASNGQAAGNEPAKASNGQVAENEPATASNGQVARNEPATASNGQVAEVEPATASAGQGVEEAVPMVAAALPTEAVVASDGSTDAEDAASEDASAALHGEDYAAWRKFATPADEAARKLACETVESLAEEYSGSCEPLSIAGDTSYYRVELPGEYMDDFLSAVSHVGEELASETREPEGDAAIVYILLEPSGAE